jgi:hypothetical protein
MRTGPGRDDARESDPFAATQAVHVEAFCPRSTGKRF